MYTVSESYTRRARAAFAKAREHYTIIMDGIAAISQGMSLDEYRAYTAQANATWQSMSPVKKGVLVAGTLVLISAMITCALRTPNKEGPTLEQRIEHVNP